MFAGVELSESDSVLLSAEVEVSTVSPSYTFWGAAVHGDGDRLAEHVNGCEAERLPDLSQFNMAMDWASLTIP